MRTRRGINAPRLPRFARVRAEFPPLSQEAEAKTARRSRDVFITRHSIHWHNLPGGRGEGGGEVGRNTAR